MADTTSSSDPFGGVFPPHWNVGDRWRARMRTEVPRLAIPGRPPPWEDVDFDFEVLSAPADDSGGNYLIDIQSPAESLHYHGFYRTLPFSFVRLEDLDGKAVAMTDERNPAAPYIDGAWGRFIKDFPVMPPVAAVGIVPCLVHGRPATQEVEVTESGLRFTIVYGMTRTIITWNRGAPWWSSLERAGVWPNLPADFLGSGVLLSSRS
jgi:hypothetical protein